MKNLHQCPNLDCQAVWGIEEISFQNCDACGYPNVDTDAEFGQNYDEDDDDDNYRYDQEREIRESFGLYDNDL
jgi:Zn ribbon nucleic-acid-binding protein